MTALKTVFFVLLVPGFLLGVVPVFVIPRIPGLVLPPGPWNWAAIPFWLAGVAVVIWCAADFVRKGHGTPVPLDPPKELVVSGLYRFVRNPMYVGALLIQAGVGCLRSNPLYLVLLIPTWAVLHWGVVLREERYLLKKFGAPYQQFMDSTRRWFL